MQTLWSKLFRRRRAPSPAPLFQVSRSEAASLRAWWGQPPAKVFERLLDDYALAHAQRLTSLQTPEQTNFARGALAATADIAAGFHQLLTKVEDEHARRDLQRERSRIAAGDGDGTRFWGSPFRARTGV